MTWIKNRHRFVKKTLTPIFKRKYNKKYHIEDIKPFNLDRPYLIMCNHQTLDDQYILGTVLKGDYYFVASDDLLTQPGFSKFLVWAVNPIPYKKASVDLGFLKKCRQVKNEGGTIVIFPEGNRTYSGETGYINPTIYKMVQFLKLPLLFITINGGFNSFPRFAKEARDGKIDIKFSRIYEPDEYLQYSDEELLKTIKDNIYVNDLSSKQIVKSSSLTEYVERVIYRCPKCGITHFTSNGNTFKCDSCNTISTYNEDNTITSPFGFKNILEFYKYQVDEIMKNNLSDMDPNHLITSDNIGFYEIIPYKKKKLISKNACISLYSNRITVKYNNVEETFMFDDINSSGCFHQNKLNIFLNDHTYQFKDNERFCALKYMQHIYKYKIEKGVIHDDFLGI